MATTIYGLRDPAFRKVNSIFRIRHEDDGLYVEKYDPAVGAWTEGPGTLLRFVNEGELGADEISEQEAERLIAAGLPPLPIPTPA